MCRACSSFLTNESVKRRRAEDANFRESHKAYCRQRNRRLRERAIDAYGGACACCGEARYEFLAIDHIHGDGASERRKFKMTGGTDIYRRLRDAGYPKDRYRLLCHNCNSSLGFYGFCPHERERLADRGDGHAMAVSDDGNVQSMSIPEQTTLAAITIG